MNRTNRIKKLELLGLGTKSAPILQEEDCRRIEKVPTIDETSDGHKAGPSRRTIIQEDTEDAEDQCNRLSGVVIGWTDVSSGTGL